MSSRNGKPPPPPPLPPPPPVLGAPTTRDAFQNVPTTKTSAETIPLSQRASMIEIRRQSNTEQLRTAEEVPRTYSDESQNKKKTPRSSFKSQETPPQSKRDSTTSVTSSRRISNDEMQTSNISIPAKGTDLNTSDSGTQGPSNPGTVSQKKESEIKSKEVEVYAPKVVLLAPKSKDKKIQGKDKTGTKKDAFLTKAPEKIAKEKKSELKANYSILISGTESDSEASSVDSDSIKKVRELTGNENAVFEAVSAGSLVTAKELFDTFTFDFNKKNIVGYTVLHIAIRRQDEEMVNLIFDEGGKSLWPSVLEDSLLHAIKEVNVDLVRTILVEIDKRGISTRKENLRNRKLLKNYLANLKVINEEEEFINSEFYEDMTPLLLSALCDSYELVEIFYDRGHVLRKPHEYICNCEECENVGPLRKAYRRLHVYQACSKPAHICYLANHRGKGKDALDFDPILVAFTLIQKVNECAEEDVFKNEYLAIADELQEFACNIIHQCRRTPEVELILEQTEGYVEASPYPRLSMAIDMHLKKFVTHRHCQQILYRYWAGKDWPEWRTKGSWSLLFITLIRIPLWPIIAFWMCLERKSSWGRLFSTPASCCLSKVTSYLFFLSFLSIVNMWNPDGANHRGLPRTGLEYVIMVWVAGFWLSIISQLTTRFKSYISNPWSWYDIVTNTLFVLAFICWCSTPSNPAIDRMHWRPHDPTLVAEILFSVASTMAYGQLFKILQLHPYFGPVVTTVGRMVYDIANVLLFFVIILSAFSLGLSRLYSPYSGWEDVDAVTNQNISQSEAFTSFSNAFESLYWSIFSMGSSSSPAIIPRTIVSIRNASFNSTNHLSFTEGVGKIINSSYHVVVSMILLNMLLGLMSRTYELVNGDVDVEWKFSRSQIWVSYGLDLVNPSPLNFIPPITASRCSRKQQDSNHVHKQAEYYKLIKILIQRYFRDKAEVAMDETATAEKIEALQEDIAEFRSLIEQTQTEHYEKRKMKTTLEKPFPEGGNPYSPRQLDSPPPAYAGSVASVFSYPSEESDNNMGPSGESNLPILSIPPISTSASLNNLTSQSRQDSEKRNVRFSP